MSDHLLMEGEPMGHCYAVVEDYPGVTPLHHVVTEEQLLAQHAWLRPLIEGGIPVLRLEIDTDTWTLHVQRQACPSREEAAAPPPPEPA